VREDLHLGELEAGMPKALLVFDLWKLHRTESWRNFLRERSYKFVYVH
jgi:hypothetical protein